MKRYNFYENSLTKMWDQVIAMGTVLEEMLTLSLEALLTKDQSKIKRILELEELVDDYHDQIEMAALELFSLQQPSIEDLRKLAAFMRIIREMERIGDLGVNFAEAAEKLTKTGEYFKPLVDIPKMFAMVMEMTSKALQAYKEQDLSLAKETCAMDQWVDEMYDYLQEELIVYMKEDAQKVEQGLQFLLIAKDLERIGDHAENIAEMVNYMVTGTRKLCK